MPGATWPSFQSLLHQGISLLPTPTSSACVPNSCVSIPSSSGHQFTETPMRTMKPSRAGSFNPFFIRASVYCPPRAGIECPCRRGFNPFFIRASVYWKTIRGSGAGAITCGFNPFFIRASVYCGATRTSAARGVDVSIPSSSGHQFTGDPASRHPRHNLRRCFNPFFIRASVY